MDNPSEGHPGQPVSDRNPDKEKNGAPLCDEDFDQLLTFQDMEP